MLLSGHSGPSQYQPIAVDVARLGYYAVLLDGKDILAADQRGGERLKAAILRAQRSDHAVPGKVAVIGFSQGGGGALTYATRLPDLAAIVVTYYPENRFHHALHRLQDVRQSLPGARSHPGRRGRQVHNCCLIETMRVLETSAREEGAPLELIVYPHADHGFNLRSGYRPDDAADGWRRTTALLRQYLSQ